MFRLAFKDKVKLKVRSVLKEWGIYIAIIAVSLLAVRFIIFPSIGDLIEKSSPWYQQSKDIIERNDTDKAFSSLYGSDVDKISNVSFWSWFSSQKSKEVTISIPKLLNTSPLFNDHQFSSTLKETLLKSVKTENLKDETKFLILNYNGSEIARWEGNKQISNFHKLSDDEERRLTDYLKDYLKNNHKEKLTFHSWEKIGSDNDVDIDYDNIKEIVKLKGKFYGKTKWYHLKKSLYEISAKLERQNDKWEVTKIKTKEVDNEK